MTESTNCRLCGDEIEADSVDDLAVAMNEHLDEHEEVVDVFETEKATAALIDPTQVDDLPSLLQAIGAQSEPFDEGEQLVDALDQAGFAVHRDDKTGRMYQDLVDVVDRYTTGPEALKPQSASGIVDALAGNLRDAADVPREEAAEALFPDLVDTRDEPPRTRLDALKEVVYGP